MRHANLQIVMERNDVSFNRLRETLEALKGLRVHVVGDTIVDSYTYCAMIGGAGIVAKHLVAAGADVTFSTVLGKDPLREFVKKDLEAAGIKLNEIVDETRPTVNKNAIVVGGYRLLKVDTLDNRSISDTILNKLCSNVRSAPADAVVYSDFRHGIFNKRTIPPLIEAIPAGIYRVADSQVASRWGNITEFKNFDLITPNEREARFAVGDQDSGIRPLASMVYDAARCKLLILKLGERGVLACRDEAHDSLDSYFVIDSFVENLVDAVGAGDALLAYSTLAMLASKNDAIATILGCIAASCECEYDGNVPVTLDNVRAKIDEVERRLSMD